MNSRIINSSRNISSLAPTISEPFPEPIKKKKLFGNCGLGLLAHATLCEKCPNTEFLLVRIWTLFTKCQGQNFSTLEYWDSLKLFETLSKDVIFYVCCIFLICSTPLSYCYLVLISFTFLKMRAAHTFMPN